MCFEFLDALLGSVANRARDSSVFSWDLPNGAFNNSLNESQFQGLQSYAGQQQRSQLGSR